MQTLYTGTFVWKLYWILLKLMRTTHVYMASLYTPTSNTSTVSTHTHTYCVTLLVVAVLTLWRQYSGPRVHLLCSTVSGRRRLSVGGCVSHEVARSRWLCQLWVAQPLGASQLGSWLDETWWPGIPVDRAALLGSWEDELLFGGQKQGVVRAWSTAYKDVRNVHGDVRNVFFWRSKHAKSKIIRDS